MLYGGTFLIVIVQGGNSNILPIAFVIVEDKHKSIGVVLNIDGSRWKPPHVFQVFCERRITANFMTHFKNKDLKKVPVNAACSKSHREFAHYFDYLRGENVAVTNWLEEMSRSQWTQYAYEGRHFGYMTTNISKYINAVMKAVTSQIFG
ncbi:hypothetical protein Ahy_A07g034841 [Arachis hypogaea]|uniref:Uncharacterized protein n=1 Tax=Arachis hypogaea TaxID=3818 RepID=A0A445CCV3_ARAHY|nr:hypothetical protein Ahy_A07g034841 [Arachis hypogaea]